jgi:hypothetical protein
MNEKFINCLRQYGRIAPLAAFRSQYAESVSVSLTDFYGDAHSAISSSARSAHRFSKSTGSLTSVTRKYFASAGYFLATASYIPYATLRYEMCPATPVRNSEM